MNLESTRWFLEMLFAGEFHFAPQLHRRRARRVAARFVAAMIVVLLASTGCKNGSKGTTSTNGGVSENGGAEGDHAENDADPTGEQTASTTPDPGFEFVDRTKDSGVDFRYRSGDESGHAAIIESLGGGVALFDFDLDGRLDLFLPGGGFYPAERETAGCPGALFRGGESWHWQDVTERAGVGAAGYYSHGAAVGDFDEDGFPDLIVTGFGGLQLWHNQGDGTFREKHLDAGLTDPSWSSSAAWGDLNGDHLLDLYVAHYVNWSFDNDPFCAGPLPGQREICPPKEFTGLDDIVYYNNGDGTFRDASGEFGLAKEGKGLGVLLADLDVDDDLDVYVANDTVENFFYINDGGGRFEEHAGLSGLAVDDNGIPNGSMGLALCDYNRDGRPDVWVTNYEREAFALYRNDGGNLFTHISRTTGITALGGLFVGFGTATTDVNGDGIDDFLVSNGHVILYPQSSPRRQQPLLLVGSEKTVHRVAFSADSYFAKDHVGRGMAIGDIDGDGDSDVAISHINDPFVVLENKCSSNSTSWINVRLIGVQSCRDATGAKLELETTGGVWAKQVVGGGSYLSHNDSRVLFRLPAGAKAKSFRIRWPSGVEQSIESLPEAGPLTVVEPAS